jgi:NAD(P)-dependent dehydrogenase (short-subunit alcohol dehydrogenase family)
MELTGLRGKIALVTGASRGIGKSIAKVLAKSGVRVICCATNQALLDQTCSEIQKDGGVAVSMRADLGSPSERKGLIEQAISEFDTIDFLINNAGIPWEQATQDLTDEKLRHIFEVNVFAMFSLARDIGKHMITRGSGGKIINMGSFWGQLGVARFFAYAVSKATVEAMTRCLAVEWARYNIQVNTVAPGHIMTDFSRDALDNEKIRKDILRRIPARRAGKPEEVAYLVAFLCSQESNYMTGHIYYIDGGQLIAW